jgi:DNA-binding NarL/FixJ family response regulator
MVLVPHAPVRVLIASRSPAWSAGVASFLPEPLEVEVTHTLEGTLAGLCAGDHDLVALDRELASSVAACLSPPSMDPDLEGVGAARLTDQERVVLRLMRQHLTYKEIAQRLGVSWHTVRTHAQSILRKCGVHSRRDLEGIDPWAPALAFAEIVSPRAPGETDKPSPKLPRG